MEHIGEVLPNACSAGVTGRKDMTIFTNSPTLSIVRSKITLRDHLVFVRAGSGDPWPFQEQVDDTDRIFDLAASYYAEPNKEGRLFRSAEYVMGGGLSKLYAAQMFLRQTALLDRYRYVWLIDDDLEFQFSVRAFIDFIQTENFALAQPSLTADSFCAFRISKHHPGLSYRTCNFVEVMAPLFRRDFLVAVIDTFDRSVSTWGIDILWGTKLSALWTAAIVDQFQMRHSRPTNDRNPFYQHLKSIGIDHWTELRNIMESLNIDAYRIRPEKFVYLIETIEKPKSTAHSSLRYVTASRPT